MKIRYPRNMTGAEKMFQDGRCWADAVLWAIDHPNGQVMTFDNVGEHRKCGYCGRCMTESEFKEKEENELPPTS